MQGLERRPKLILLWACRMWQGHAKHLLLELCMPSHHGGNTSNMLYVSRFRRTTTCLLQTVVQESGPAWTQKHHPQKNLYFNCNLHFAVVKQHAVHFLNGSLGRLLGLKVHKAVALGSILIANHLEGQRVSKSDCQNHAHLATQSMYTSSEIFHDVLWLTDMQISN